MKHIKHEAQAVHVAKSTLLHRLYPKVSAGFLDDNQIFEAVMGYLCTETELVENHPDKVQDCALEVCDYLYAVLPNNRA
tara:strand:+ start:183 stop:419 length:237 start_codon:yes stop_codon:yes gene_type:complete